MSERLTRRQAGLALGCAALGGLVAIPLSAQKALADRAEEERERWYNEHHPKIHHAVVALRDAKVALEEAKHDYGGHRKEALEAVDHALKQLHLAEEYGRK